MQAQALRMCRSSLRTGAGFGNFVKAKPVAISTVAIGKRALPSTADDWSLSKRAESPVEVRRRALTQQAPGQQVSQSSARTPGKAQSALPSSQSGAAAVGYGSRQLHLRASAESTANPWTLNRLQRGAGSARRVFGSSTSAGSPKARPNPSLKLTRYGKRCKPGPRHMVHHREPGLQHLPPRAA